MPAVLRRVLLPSSPGAFRLWLALVVVLHHVTRLEIGKFPVLVFFALSGYWVERVWTARYARTRHPWATFVISRWWRLAPMMVVAALACVLAFIATHDPAVPALAGMVPRQIFSSLFVLGYAQMPVRPVGPAWSLDIEIQFYFVAPLLFAIAARMRWPLALFLAYLVYAIGIALYPELVLTSFLVPFVVGMLAARDEWRVSPRIGLAGQALVIALVVLAYVSPWKAQLLDAGEDHWWPLFNIVLAALCLPQALVSVRSGEAEGEVGGGARDKLWADQSYVVYLLHWPAILVYRAVPWPDPAARAQGLAGLALLVGLACWAAHRWIDRPLNRARARWVAGRHVGAVSRDATPTCSPASPLRYAGLGEG